MDGIELRLLGVRAHNPFRVMTSRVGISKEPDVHSTRNDEFESMLIAILVRPQVGGVAQCLP